MNVANKQKFRGKLYTLSEDSAWEDKGTGFVSVTGTAEKRRLVFRDEETNQVLHDRPVYPVGTYNLQGEGDQQAKVIVWEDPESQKDWALSFQDPAGTAEIWEALNDEGSGDTGGKRILPLPRLGNLADLARMLFCVPPSQREAYAADCVGAKFINGLREIFHTAEDLGSEEDLHLLWRIVKGVFLLSNQKATERYLRQDIYEDVLGIMEYDEGLPADKRIAHRQVFQVQVKFNHVISLDDADMLERIHLNYRLQYLKDIVLPRLLDDAAFVSLTQMIYANISIILGHLQRNLQLLERLFTQIRSGDLSGLLFLQELCRLSKQVAPPQRQELFEKMNGLRLFEVLAPFFAQGPLADSASPGPSSGPATSGPAASGPAAAGVASSEASSEAGAEGAPKAPPRAQGSAGGAASPRHVAVEILLISSLNDAAHLRRFLLSSEGAGTGRVLLLALIHVMLTEADQGIQGQTADVLKSVMDPSGLDNQERDRCLDIIYEEGVLDALVAPLRADAAKPETQQSCFALQLVCELLAFAIVQHGYRAKVYVIRHGLLQHVARLLTAKRRFLQLAPVRLLRAVVATKDDAYHRFLAKSGVFTPLMRSFQLSARPPALGNNLLVGATLDLLELIRVENVKILVDHLCSKHSALFQELASQYKPLAAMLLKQQQNQEYEAFPPEQHSGGGPMRNSGPGSGGGGSGRGSGRTRSPSRDDSDDDEAYFESLDEEEEEDANSANTSTQANISAEGESKQLPQPSSGDEPVPDRSLKNLLGSYQDEEEEDTTTESAHSSAEVLGQASTDPVADSDQTSPDQTSHPAHGSASTHDAGATLGIQENAGFATKRSGETDVVVGGDTEDVVAPQETLEDGSQEHQADDQFGEKILNHMPKRLKTSATGSP